jgi:hypothetical protein
MPVEEMHTTIGDGRASMNLLQEVWHFGRKTHERSLDHIGATLESCRAVDPLGRPIQQRAIPVLLEDLSCKA